MIFNRKEIEYVVLDEGDKEPVKRIEHADIDHGQKRYAAEKIGVPQRQTPHAEFARRVTGKGIPLFGYVFPKKGLFGQDRPIEHDDSKQ